MASDDLKGYDCQFIDPIPDSLLCLICTCVSRDPQQTVCCGRMYCCRCLSDLRSSCRVSRCPQCRKEPISSFPDTRGMKSVDFIKPRTHGPGYESKVKT
jgi:TNF receptor-associated factor 4